jgi:hypothetical protein
LNRSLAAPPEASTDTDTGDVTAEDSETAWRAAVGRTGERRYNGARSDSDEMDRSFEDES